MRLGMRHAVWLFRRPYGQVRCAGLTNPGTRDMLSAVVAFPGAKNFQSAAQHTASLPRNRTSFISEPAIIAVRCMHALA